MMHSFDDASTIGKEFMDTGLKSFSAMTKGMQAISVEATEFSRKQFEQNSAAMEKFAGVTSLDKAFEVQSELARQSYEGMVAQATRMSELYADLAKEAYKPFESMVAKAR